MYMYRKVEMFFFFNDTATTEIYTLSLHDALPISPAGTFRYLTAAIRSLLSSRVRASASVSPTSGGTVRSEEHTSELQSRQYLVCRLLLEKKNKNIPHQPLTLYTLNPSTLALTLYV